MSKHLEVDQKHINKVRAIDMLHIEHIMAVLLKSGNRIGLKYILVKTGSTNKLSSYVINRFVISFNCQICKDAQADWNMEQVFWKVKQKWEAKIFQLDKFTPPVWHYC